MSEKNDLGLFLRAAREQKQLTLRGVEHAVGVSNAYLSQIESGKIKKPSPNILHQLCVLYEMPYSYALQLAGYPIPASDEDDTEQHSSNFLPNLGPITDEEEQALIEYLAFFRSRRSRKD
ncbi:helix-turn-helix transcriptional regulator [Betaproteobacteria bacterium PRO4]|nr:helix-turn-helix transcriptional regulator [Betaproteobacteria bacterium PRO4]